MFRPAVTSAISVLAIAAAPSASVHAAYNHYTDKAAFLSASGALSASGPVPDTGPVASPQVLGSVTVSLAAGASQLFFGGPGPQTPRIPGSEITVSGNTNLNFTFSIAIHAVGFDIVEPEADLAGSGQVFTDSTFSLTLKNGGTKVGYFEFNPANDSREFIGLVSSLPFSTVELREISGGPDSEFLGEIFTTVSPLAVSYAESGDVLPQFTAFDAALRGYLEESNFPGITAAVCYDGRLIYRRSFGWTDYTHSTPLHYSTPMGLGSCTKPLTTTIVKNLIRAGLLSDSDRLVDLLNLTPPSGMQWAPGFSDILVSHLEAHTSGLLRYKPDNNAVGSVLGLGRPANFLELIAYQGAQPLLFPPGTDNSYSNFGFGILGAIIEKVTGDRYEKAVTEQLGKMLDSPTIRGPSDEPYTTPTPAGVLPATLYYNNSAAGGMLASAQDYCRFMRAFKMTGLPKATATPGGVFNYTFYGSVDDVFALARQRLTGGHALEWCICTNDRGYQSVGYLDDFTAPALLSIAGFPAHDFFPYYNWKIGWYWNASLGIMNPGSGHAEDSDGDGLPTAIEYAFGRFPHTPDAGPPLLTLAAAGSGAALRFRRHPLRNDVAYELETAASLLGPWTTLSRSAGGTPSVPAAPADWSVAEAPVGSLGEQEITVSSLHPPPPSAHFRLRIVP